MKRSQIDTEIRAVIEFLKNRSFALPPFAFWSLEEWKKAGPECRRIVGCRLGWDVSDFGSRDFDRMGAILFTIRNGNLHAPESGTPYAEKAIIHKPGQRMPLHFHWSKTEDIINRGGGRLMMELYNARKDDSVDRESPVTICCDGKEVRFPAGVPVELHPGESMTLTPRIYHKFWAHADGGMLLVGEVSSVNDDETDNCFAEPVSRFAEIDEDVPAAFVLCNEYVSRIHHNP